MSLVETSTNPNTKRKSKAPAKPAGGAPKPKYQQRKPKPAFVNTSDFCWGAQMIGAEIGRSEKQCRHLMPMLVKAGAVRKVNGLFVGNRPKLRALFGGE